MPSWSPALFSAWLMPHPVRMQRQALSEIPNSATGGCRRVDRGRVRAALQTLQQAAACIRTAPAWNAPQRSLVNSLRGCNSAKRWTRQRWKTLRCSYSRRSSRSSERPTRRPVGTPQGSAPAPLCPPASSVGPALSGTRARGPEHWVHLGSRGPATRWNRESGGTRRGDTSALATRCHRQVGTAKPRGRWELHLKETRLNPGEKNDWFVLDQKEVRILLSLLNTQMKVEVRVSVIVYSYTQIHYISTAEAVKFI